MPALRFAEAVDLGVTEGLVRGPGWSRISHGFHAPAEPGRSLRSVAGLTAAALPRESGFGHLTSAALRGWWLPNGVDERLTGPLFASTTSRVHVKRGGLYVRRSEYTRVETVDGLPLVTAEETLVELARDLTLVDLVPLVDCALARGASPSAILLAADRRSKGMAHLRQAVMLSDPRSESWWESVLRLLHVIAELGPVESQVEVELDGVPVARADLWLVGTKHYPECDGGEHRTKERHEHDLRRGAAMARADAARYGYSVSDIATRPDVIIRDGESARGLDHDPRRVRAWWRVARASTVTTFGRYRLLRRLDRYRQAADRQLARDRPATAS